eukprot:4573059-Amphidinium_carterae.1
MPVCFCASIAEKRVDFKGLETSLVQSYSQLKFDDKNQKEDRKAALNTALGGGWHESQAHKAFQV